MIAIRYIVNDVDESVDFYTAKLGFTLVQQFGPAIAIMERDGIRLWLAGPTSSAARHMPDWTQPAPGGWNRFVLIIASIEQRVASLKELGVEFRSDIVVGPGGKQIVMNDPSGNPVELFEEA